MDHRCPKCGYEFPLVRGFKYCTCKECFVDRAEFYERTGGEIEQIRES